jgi:hypothetical protein
LSGDAEFPSSRCIAVPTSPAVTAGRRSETARYLRPMGAWDVGPFDNDDASDWALEFDGLDANAGLQVLNDALAVGECGEYIEAPAGTNAVAAAAVVTWMRNHALIPESPYGEAAANGCALRGRRRRPSWSPSQCQHSIRSDLTGPNSPTCGLTATTPRGERRSRSSKLDSTTEDDAGSTSLCG